MKKSLSVEILSCEPVVFFFFFLSNAGVIGFPSGIPWAKGGPELVGT